ncbi:hypothetical protein RJT34_17481 [Clitoria ternatea]|uniref:Uncharacterized protein n=1 Tax=Clitoria ternatea TaxID=43366 RepID=A0AAN9J9F1_CLITE
MQHVRVLQENSFIADEEIGFCWQLGRKEKLNEKVKKKRKQSFEQIETCEGMKQLKILQVEMAIAGAESLIQPKRNAPKAKVKTINFPVHEAREIPLLKDVPE